MVQPSAAEVKDHRICALLHASKVTSGREPASQRDGCLRVCFLAAFHMEFMLTPSAHSHTYNIRVSVKYRERRSTHRIVSHRIESHHIASYRIATAPGAIAESRPFFCRLQCLHIRLLEGENPSNSVSLFVWSPVCSPVQGHRHLGAFQSQQYFCLKYRLCRTADCWGTTSPLIAARLDLISRSVHEMNNACCLASGWRTRCADACIACLWFAFDSDERKCMKFTSEVHPRDRIVCMQTVVVQTRSLPRIVCLRLKRGRPQGIHRENNRKHELHTRRSSESFFVICTEQ